MNEIEEMYRELTDKQKRYKLFHSPDSNIAKYIRENWVEWRIENGYPVGCPHCGSQTKHKSWCPDQQVINAFKDLKEAEQSQNLNIRYGFYLVGLGDTPKSAQKRLLAHDKTRQRQLGEKGAKTGVKGDCNACTFWSYLLS